MNRRLYTLLYYLILPGIFLRLWWRGRKAPAYRLRWNERLGFRLPVVEPGCIWVHAVSVGETIAAAPLINELIERYPQRQICITCMTPTGSERVQALFGDRVAHCYLPYDVPCAVKRFLRHTRPELLVVMETELWPNLVYGCHRAGIPVLIANARLSNKSFKGYSRFMPLVTPLLRQVKLVAAQHRDDGERFVALGLPREKLSITGSIKFDLQVPAEVQARGQEWRNSWSRQHVWIAASTHKGEDELMLEAHRQLLQHDPDALLILVPRHPERFNEVFSLCQRQGFSTVRRSQSEPVGPQTQILLGDTMGELMSFYAAADLAFVGGSLVKNGGHNFLEPAALSKPVIAGPSVFNFAAISAMLMSAGAMAQVNSSRELAKLLQQLLSDPYQTLRYGQAGLSVVEANRGARQKLLGLIDGFLSN